jgi:ADP-glucose pyrophosphorylase
MAVEQHHRQRRDHLRRRVRDSVVFNNVFVHSYCNIEQSILMQGGNIGRGARLRRVICDKYVHHRRRRRASAEKPDGRRAALPRQPERHRRHPEGRHRTARGAAVVEHARCRPPAASSPASTNPAR